MFEHFWKWTFEMWNAHLLFTFPSTPLVFIISVCIRAEVILIKAMMQPACWSCQNVSSLAIACLTGFLCTTIICTITYDRAGSVLKIPVQCRHMLYLRTVEAATYIRPATHCPETSAINPFCISCLFYYFTLLFYVPRVLFYCISFVSCYCGSVSDHLVLLLLINLIWFDLIWLHITGTDFWYACVMQIRYLYTVSQKTCHQTFVYIFTKYWPILKIPSLAHSVVNVQ